MRELNGVFGPELRHTFLLPTAQSPPKATTSSGLDGRTYPTHFSIFLRVMPLCHLIASQGPHYPFKLLLELHTVVFPSGEVGRETRRDRRRLPALPTLEHITIKVQRNDDVVTVLAFPCQRLRNLITYPPAHQRCSRADHKDFIMEPDRAIDFVEDAVAGGHPFRRASSGYRAFVAYRASAGRSLCPYGCS